MKKTKRVLFILVSLLLVLGFTACSDDDTSVTKITVLFDSQGATTPASPTNMLVVAGSSVASLPTAPVKTGYTFGEWFTAESGGGIAFTINTVVMNNITVYAKWTLSNYTVSFDSQGGSVVSNQNLDYGEKVTEPTAPTKVGYTFGGWYTESA